MHFFQKTQLPERFGGKFRWDFNRTFYPKEQITTVISNAPPLLPRQTHRQVLSFCQRAAGGGMEWIFLWNGWCRAVIIWHPYIVAAFSRNPRNPRSIIFQQFINRIFPLVFWHFSAESLPLLDENLPDFNLLFIRKIAS